MIYYAMVQTEVQNTLDIYLRHSNKCMIAVVNELRHDTLVGSSGVLGSEGTEKTA